MPLNNFPSNSDLIQEGTSNLYFTDERVASSPAVTELQNTGVDTTARAEISAIIEEDQKTKITYYAPKATTVKARLTIVDDDARSEVYTILKPIAEARSVPFTVAVPIEYATGTALTDEQMLYLQNTLGWEMACHTYTHPDLRVTTDANLLHEIVDSKKVLEAKGLNIYNIVYPFGSGEGGTNSAHIKELSSKYYNCGANVGGGVNTKPVNSFKIGRVPLGSSYAAGQGTYAYYQSKVDEAITNNGWIVFMTHCYNDQFDETQQQALSDILDYALANNVEVVTLQQGYEQMGNRLEVEGSFAVGIDGISRELNNYKNVLTSTLAGDALITAYGKGSFTRRSYNNTTKGTLPEAGTLETFRPFIEDNYGYQKLYGYFNNVYYRRWLDADGWKPWKQMALKQFYSVTVDCGTINAGAMRNYSLAGSLPTLAIRSVVMIHPNVDMNVASEIMISNSGYRVYMYNTYTSEITVGNVTFNVMVITET